MQEGREKRPVTPEAHRKASKAMFSKERCKLFGKIKEHRKAW